MPLYRRYFHPGQLQFITSNSYRRAAGFAGQRSIRTTPSLGVDSTGRMPVLRRRFRRDFVQVLNQLRHEMQFLLVGWVLMPEHFHLLIKPEPADTTSLILPRLKDRTARRILAALRKHPENSWCRKMLARFRLPPSVHDESHGRVWQRRFYPFNVYSERKRLEKLDYMHHNPVKRGLVSSPDQWPWSSWRFYYMDDASVLEMDRCP